MVLFIYFKLKKYIVDFSAASFAYIILTKIGQHIIADTDTIHMPRLDYVKIYDGLPNLKLYTY